MNKDEIERKDLYPLRQSLEDMILQCRKKTLMAIDSWKESGQLVINRSLTILPSHSHRKQLSGCLSTRQSPVSITLSFRNRKK
jgi:hypothetical protein